MNTNGMRIVVAGTQGAGKTTVARQVAVWAKGQGIPYILHDDNKMAIDNDQQVLVIGTMQTKEAQGPAVPPNKDIMITVSGLDMDESAEMAGLIGHLLADRAGTVVKISPPEDDSGCSVDPKKPNKKDKKAKPNPEDKQKKPAAAANSSALLTDAERDALLSTRPARTVTKDGITARIAVTRFTRLSGTMTLCEITMQNGFVILGKSACAHPDNFDEKLGNKIAYDNAFDQIWALEGYLLREALMIEAGIEEAKKKSTGQDNQKQDEKAA